jgi:hypothetical protein
MLHARWLDLGKKYVIYLGKNEIGRKDRMGQKEEER